MRIWRRFAAIAPLLLVAGFGLGCRAVETPEELQALAGDVPPVQEASRPPSGGTPVGDEDLDGFPLVGSVLPGLAGGLHSSLCDPASDPYSTCI